MKKLSIVATVLASVLTIPAQAELDKLYLEGSVGQTEFQVDGADNTDDTSVGFLAGYQVLQHDALNVSAELGFNQYLHEEEETILGDVSNTISSVSLGAKVGYEVMPKLEVFGRLAYESMTQEVEFLGMSASESADEVTYGIGASYEVMEKLSVGTQYKYAKLDEETDLSNVNLFVGYQF